LVTPAYYLHIRTFAYLHIAYLCAMKPGKQQVFSISNDEEFNAATLQVFQHQAKNCKVYADFISGLGIDPATITNIQVELTFTSSGTTGMITSSHHVTDKTWYEDSFRNAFQLFYGDIKDYTVLALLPSYLEREGSSLIYMVDDLINNLITRIAAFFCITTMNFTNSAKTTGKKANPINRRNLCFA
jgi:hypothetical protein